MKGTQISIALAAATLSLSQVATAVPITIKSSLADGAYLSPGSYTGQFDARAALPAQYQVNSASYIFKFQDDADQTQTQIQLVSGSASGYVRNNNSSYYDDGYYYYTYINTRNNYYFRTIEGQRESAYLAIEGASIGSGRTAEFSQYEEPEVTSSITFERTAVFPGYWYSCGNSFCYNRGRYESYYTNVYNSTNTQRRDWLGGFDIMGEISDITVLNRLETAGVLNFTLAVIGDLNLIESRLLLDYTEIEPQSAGVPEPSSAALLMAALFGIGIFRTGRCARNL